MKLISLNIELDRHLDTVFSFLEKEKPDVICLQEVLEEDFPKFEQLTKLKGIFQPWGYVKNQHYKNIYGKKQGVAIFSKNIIESGHVFYFGNEKNILKSFDEYMSEKNFQKNYAFVWANIKDDNGESYRFITTHLPATEKGESSPFQLTVADSLLDKLDSFGEFVLCGDMNAPRGNETFNRLNKKYKDNIPLEYKTSIDQNLHRVKGIQFMVDCLFTTPIYQVSNAKLMDKISDHMAIVAEINKIYLHKKYF